MDTTINIHYTYNYPDDSVDDIIECKLTTLSSVIENLWSVAEPDLTSLTIVITKRS